MKSFLIKLIISLLIVIFVPLPTPAFFIEQCVGETFAPCIEQPTSAKFGSRLIEHIVYDFTPRDGGDPAIEAMPTIVLALMSAIYLGITYLLLTVVEFVFSKLKQKST
ncbi:MAG: hypothetical protein ABIM99_00675 [Candidatus Dojkabacteria bacterium]